MSADYQNGASYNPNLFSTIGGRRSDTPTDQTGANGNVGVLTFDPAGALRVNEEGGNPTYYATSTFACDSTGTDIAVFPGSALVTAKLLAIIISSEATTRANGTISIIRRSAVDTAGTPVAASIAKADGRDAAASCAPVHYTAHPTGLGASAGTLVGMTYIQPALATDNLNPMISIPLQQFNGGKAVRVSGIADLICVNVPAALGGSGNVWNITWIWIEQPLTA